MAYPNSNSTISPARTSTSVGLSTQIIIKVQDYTVGAIQELRINQTRALKRHNEIGTDGVVEIIPTSPTAVSVSVRRIVFDGMNLPEAFARAFINIQAQRIPFNIDIFDMQHKVKNLTFPNDQVVEVNLQPSVKRIHNCWFASLTTPYDAGNFIISESAEIQAEYITSFTPALNKSLRPAWPGQLANVDSIEKEIDVTGKRGSFSETSMEPATRIVGGSFRKGIQKLANI